MREVSLFLLFTRGFERLHARYMVSGSVAAMIYGVPRLTNDVDLVAELGPEDVTRLPEVFPPDQFYCPPPEVVRIEVLREQRGHFNIIHQESGFKADIYLCGRDELQAWGLARTRRIDLAGETLAVAPPEYVILRKLEFFREGGSEKHVRDIRSMLAVSSDVIDRAELERWATVRGLREVWERVLAAGP